MTMTKMYVPFYADDDDDDDDDDGEDVCSFLFVLKIATYTAA